MIGGRYRLLERIGAGGMGEVWRARDTELEREVALKLLAMHHVADPVAIERFRREAIALAALQHPHVVGVYDAGTSDDVAYLVMELLPGPSLATRLEREGPLPQEEVRRLGAQVAAGLAAAHAAGIVHRDIKPANVVTDRTGAVKLVDFGIARDVVAPAEPLTQTNTIVGSAPYVSPEQFEGRPADARGDLYALGCLLTALLTGRPPYDGQTPVALAHQHLTVTLPPTAQRCPGTEPALAGLIDELLAKDPDRRPSSAAAVAARLAAPATAGPASGGPAPAGPTGPAAGATAPLEPVPPSTRAEGVAAATRAESVRPATRAESVAATRALPGPPGTAATVPPGASTGTGAASRAGRGRWPLVLAALVAVGALVALGLALRPDPDSSAAPGSSTTSSPAGTRTSSGAQTSHASSPGSTPPAASSPAPATSTPPTSTRPATAGSPVARMRTIVDQAAAAGQIDAGTAAALLAKIDQLDRPGKKPGKKIEDLIEFVEKLREKDRMPRATATQLIAAARGLSAGDDG